MNTKGAITYGMSFYNPSSIIKNNYIINTNPNSEFTSFVTSGFVDPHVSQIGNVFAIGVPSGIYPAVAGIPLNSTYKTLVPITTVGTATYTASQIVNSIVNRSGNSVAVTDVMPAASTLYALLGIPNIGSSFSFVIANNNTSTGAITLANAGDATGTLSGGSNVISINTAVTVVVYVNALTPITYLFWVTI